MDYYKGLDTLMGYKGLTSSESFTAWYQSVIAPYESQELDLTGFDWDLPQVDFDYQQLEIEGQLKVMATYLDAYSEPIPLGTKGIGALHGSVPRHKAIFRRDEGDMRAIEIARQKINASVSLLGAPSGTSFDDVITESLAGGLFELTDAHVGTLNYQRGQMASTGQVTLNTKNNPRGIQGVTFTAQVPKENTVEKEWYAQGGMSGVGAPKFNEEADPVGDIRDFVHKARRLYRNVEMEVNAESFYEMMKHPKWQVELGYLRNPVLRLAGSEGVTQATELAKGIFEEEQQQLFRQLVGIPVKFNNIICGVERWDKAKKDLVRDQLDAFEPHVFAIRPVGAIGTIKNVIPMRPDRQAISTLIYGGRGIIEYRYDAKFKVQEWVSELTALCVPNRPKDMFFLKIKEKASEAV